MLSFIAQKKAYMLFVQLPNWKSLGTVYVINSKLFLVDCILDRCRIQTKCESNLSVNIEWIEFFFALVQLQMAGR